MPTALPLTLPSQTCSSNQIVFLKLGAAWGHGGGAHSRCNTNVVSPAHSLAACAHIGVKGLCPPEYNVVGRL